MEQYRTMSTARTILAAVVLGAGCQGEPARQPAGSTEGDGDAATAEVRGVIGYSALTLTNPFFKVIAQNMEDELADHGYQMLLNSGEQDVKRQAEQIDDFIVREVSAIVINPCDSQSIGPAIARANAAGIPVFTNDIKYDGSVGEVVCHVATDNLQGGRLAGEAMIKHLGDAGGKVAILHYPDVESCQRRVEGFQDVIDGHNAKPDIEPIEIVATLDSRAKRDGAFKAASDIIEAHPDLSAVFAINDPAALGAYEALEGVGKADQVTLIGFDGQMIGKRAIKEGKILCDPVQFPDRIGRKTVEMIVKHFAGEEVENELLIPSELYYQADALRDPELN